MNKFHAALICSTIYNAVGGGNVKPGDIYPEFDEPTSAAASSESLHDYWKSHVLPFFNGVQ